MWGKSAPHPAPQILKKIAKKGKGGSGVSQGGRNGHVRAHHPSSRRNGWQTLHPGYARHCGDDCGQIAGVRSIDDLLADFPHVERADIVQALRYAAWRSEEREVQLTEA